MANSPLFFVNLCFFQVALFHVFAKLCFAENTIKSVFSRAQLLCITDSTTPFRGKTQSGTFATKSAILGFPHACWNSYFCSVWWLWMGTKRDHFPKTDSCNENARFLYLPNTNSVCLFSKKCHFCKNIFIVHNNPPQNKTLLSGCFFWNFRCPCFSYFLFFFLQQKDKNKKCLFLSKTLFLTPWQTAQ